MKKLILLASVLFLTTAAQAQMIKISVDNRSNEPMTIQKFDGLLTVPANTKIENQLFRANEVVTNYVDGKKRCTWKLKLYDKHQYVIGLFYSTDKIFSPGCIVIAGYHT